MEPIIIGAGLAGLMAGNLIKDARVFEASAHLPAHRAVLRFRSPDVGDALGIPFERVTVRKGIWTGEFRNPSILLANQYSKKVVGSFHDRSIWNIDSAERWVAPEDFAQRMADALGSRLSLSCPFEFEPLSMSGQVDRTRAVISTVPMPILERIFVGDDIKFAYSGIYVRRYRVSGANVHQTIYFPEEDLKLYRATITRDVLSMEFTEHPKGQSEFKRCGEAFGLRIFADAEFLDDGLQKFGKLIPLDERWRRSFIRNMTAEYRIYSLGRFATWRNILLDDVLKDVQIIRKLINADSYDTGLRDARGK